MKSILALSATVALCASSALAHGDHHDRQALHRRAAAKQAGWIRRNKRQADAVLLAVPGSTNATSSVAPAASASASSTAVQPTYNGTALWFYETGATGACLEVNTDDDLIVGLSDVFWPNTGVISEYCGKKVLLTNTDNGKTVTATVADASGKEYTTLTRAAFLQLSPLSVGMIPVTFQFLDADAAVPTALAVNGTTPVSVAGSSAPSSASPADESVSGAVFTGSGAVKVLAGATPSSTAAETTQAPAVKTTAAPTSTFDSISAASASKASVAAAQASKELAQEAAEEQAEASSKAAAQAASSREAVLLAASQSAEAIAAASSSRAAAAAASSQAAAEAAASSSAAAAAAASSKAAAAAASSQAAAEAAASSSAAAAAAASAKASANSGSSSSGKTYTGGIATYFYQNGVAGNCGKVNSDSTPLVALPTVTYAGGSHCGQTVTIKRLDTGNTITALVADSCPTCENNNCLDLSWGAFSSLGGTESMGVFDIEWFN
ncbi:hypothetical protein JCM8547_002453 [Rhodosporidiobolus lusitaniae]